MTSALKVDSIGPNTAATLTLTNVVLTTPTLTNATLVNPTLGTPASGTLTNTTGLPIATGITGLGTGVATGLANNVTGSGSPVLATSPTLVTPILGTPTSGTLTNCTGLPVAGLSNFTVITNSLSGDVTMNNTSNYFDGPSVAQGSSGTWLAFGAITLEDTAGAALFDVKLWDGTTVIASNAVTQSGATQRVTVALSGTLASPAGNIRISAKDVSSTSGIMQYNASGNAKDSTITVIRIA